MLPDQLRLRSMQVRIHERWLLHQLHERRQGMLRHDSGVLQLSEAMLRERLRLLHLLQQHTGLLRHLRLIEVVCSLVETKKPRAVDGQTGKIRHGALFAAYAASSTNNT